MKNRRRMQAASVMSGFCGYADRSPELQDGGNGYEKNTGLIRG